MKFLLFTFISILFLLTLVSAQNSALSTFQKFSREQENLKGNVWTVHTSEYLFGETLSSFIQVFDTCGKTTDKLFYLNGTSPDVPSHPVFQYAKSFYIYDESGKLKTEKSCNTGISSCVETNYKYDGNLLIEDSTVNSENKLTERNDYSYDNKSNLIKVINYVSGQTGLIKNGVATYNSKGNELEWIVFLNEKDILLRETFTYDRNGNLQSTTEYDDNNKPQFIYRYIYKFDAQGNWIEQQAFLHYVEKGVKKSTPKEINYRKIVYYQNKNRYQDDYRCSTGTTSK